ncbi:MAG: hypothetical protein K0Q72_312 [Armatimonadetes bacterium]|nr:hypothetical protein [Armatimonadota bacterium]
MPKALPRVVKLAHRSLRNDAPGDDTASSAPGDVLQQRCRALSARLSPLVGQEGFRALSARALARATGEAPWLNGVTVDPAGLLSGLEVALLAQEAAERASGCAAILAQFIGLLRAVVGPEITRQLVSSAWPDLLVTDADFGVEEDEV